MHKSKEIVWLVICFLFLSSFFVFCSDGPCKASGNTIYVDGTVIYSGSGTVDDPFKTIQAAIDAAEDGDTIKVLPGTYGGDIVIDKSITLMSGDATGTIITGGSDSRYLIDITADSVSLEGFKIRDMTETSHRKAVIHIASGTSDVVIINNRINHSANGRGIYLDNTYKAIIKNNIINDTFGSCIYIENSNSNGVGSHTIYGNYIGNCTRNPALQIMSSSQNHIENNTFRNSTNGIYIVDSSDNHMKSNKLYRNSNSGIVLEGGSGNIVENSTIYNNVNLGIDMDSSLGQIIKNNIYSNGIGISLGSSGDIVRNNSIHRSKMYGIYAGTDSNDNTIFKNTFHINLGISHAKDDGNNQWDDGVNGNYWDDFKGPDPTSSSNTYTYSERPEEYYYTRGGVLDRHPTGSYQKPPQITNPNPGQLATGVSKQPTLSVKVTDPDNGIMDVYFYYILDDVSHLIQIDANVESGATASVPFFSTESDNKGYTYKGLGYDYICLWYVIAKDKYSQTTSAQWIFTTRHVPIDNKKPTVDAGGPYTGEVGDNIQFDGSGCNDTDGTIVFYRWSFGDGESAINVRSPIHVYRNPGKYNVSLVVIDNYGSSAVDYILVEIGSPRNDPPSAKIDGLTSANLGEVMQFSGSGSWDPDGANEIVSYFWDFGDESNATGSDVTHSYSKIGTYKVTLTVTDKEGASDSGSIYVEIITSSNNNTPGYELILAIVAVLLVIIFRRRK